MTKTSCTQIQMNKTRNEAMLDWIICRNMENINEVRTLDEFSSDHSSTLVAIGKTKEMKIQVEFISCGKLDRSIWGKINPFGIDIQCDVEEQAKIFTKNIQMAQKAVRI